MYIYIYKPIYDVYTSSLRCWRLTVLFFTFAVKRRNNHKSNSHCALDPLGTCRTTGESDVTTQVMRLCTTPVHCDIRHEMKGGKPLLSQTIPVPLKLCERPKLLGMLHCILYTYNWYNVYIYVYIYMFNYLYVMYIYIHIYIHMYVYINIQELLLSL